MHISNFFFWKEAQTPEIKPHEPSANNHDPAHLKSHVSINSLGTVITAYGIIKWDSILDDRV